jgi:aminoglycoside phosphotransferase (APT) family kinase protein
MGLEGRGRDASFGIGEAIAMAHSMDISLGDTRPDNFIVDRKGKSTLLDLEQSRQGGDPAWDVAEFLYYSGHYWLSYNESLKDVTGAFVAGYLSARGSKAILRYAASAKYLRLFSIWTQPFVLTGIRRRLLRP